MEALRYTLLKRPDLLNNKKLSEEDKEILKTLKEGGEI